MKSYTTKLLGDKERGPKGWEFRFKDPTQNQIIQEAILSIGEVKRKSNFMEMGRMPEWLTLGPEPE